MQKAVQEEMAFRQIGNRRAADLRSFADTYSVPRQFGPRECTSVGVGIKRTGNGFPMGNLGFDKNLEIPLRPTTKTSSYQ